MENGGIPLEQSGTDGDSSANECHFSDHNLTTTMNDDDGPLDPLEPTLDLYFIGIEGGPVKIGVSTDICGRIASLQTACPYPLKLEALLLGGGHMERSYHQQFASARMQGEWFHRTDEVRREIARLSEMWDLDIPPTIEG